MSDDPVQPPVSDLESFCKALRLDDKPAGRWLRFQWWFEEAVYWRLPRPVRRAWYLIKDWWYRQVDCRLNPRQRWLTRSIPRVWSDKTELIVDVLYAFVIHFVEGEKCFEVTDWEGSDLGEQAAQLKEIYEWAKTGRPAFLKRIEDAYPPLEPIEWKKLDDGWLEWIHRDDPVRDAAYREVRRLEEELEAIDTKHLETIVRLREYLWT